MKRAEASHVRAGVFLLALVQLSSFGTGVLAAESRERYAPFGLESVYDRLENVRFVNTMSSPLVLADSPRLGEVDFFAQVKCSGDTIASPLLGRFTFVALGDPARDASETEELVILADERQFKLSAPEHLKLESSPDTFHGLRFAVPLRTVLAIADAKIVEGRLGIMEFSLSSKNYEALHNMALLIRSVHPELRISSRSPASKPVTKEK